MYGGLPTTTLRHHRPPQGAGSRPVTHCASTAGGRIGVPAAIRRLRRPPAGDLHVLHLEVDRHGSRHQARQGRVHGSGRSRSALHHRAEECPGAA